MEQNMKEIFDKVNMDEHKMTEIRSCLDKKRNMPVWPEAIACVAVGIAILLAIPTTRTMITYATDRIVHIFHTADGGEVTYEETNNEYLFSISYPIEDSYIEVSNNRIYLKVDDNKIDVTEYCDKESYYRYEKTYSDGGKSVIFVGGSIEKVGYIELVFDENGKYVFNKMYVPVSGDYENVEPWVDNAMHSENVPTGNWELDKEIDE